MHLYHISVSSHRLISSYALCKLKSLVFFFYLVSNVFNVNLHIHTQIYSAFCLIKVHSLTQ